MRTKRRNNKGFTLIEIVVAMALSSILFAAALSLLAPLYRENRRIHGSAQGQQLAAGLIDEMRLRAEGASSVYAATVNGSGQVHVDTSVYKVDENGVLTLDDKPVFSAELYGDMSVELQSESVANNLVQATVTVRMDGRTLCAVPGLVGTLRRVLDYGNGLVFSSPPPSESLNAAILALNWNSDRIDSTAPLTYTSGNPTTVARMRDWLLSQGVDFDALNIRSWAVIREGEHKVMWWTDQDISAYQAGDWVRVIRFNPNLDTYTPGYAKLENKTTTGISGSYIVIIGGAPNSGKWLDGGMAAADKKSYEKAIDYFNDMAIARP